MVDWKNPEALVSKYFKVKETLFLPQWNCYHYPSQQDKAKILVMAACMDKVREFLKLPITVHCWIRPILNNITSPHHGQDYNALVGGAKNSAHRVGCAVDFDASENCDLSRTKLLPNLEKWGLRMEQLPKGSNWVHLDNFPVPPGGRRYFIP